MLEKLKWLFQWLSGPSRIEIVELSDKLLKTANSASDMAKQAIAEVAALQKKVLTMQAAQFNLESAMAEVQAAEQLCKHELAAMKAAIIARDEK